MRWTFALGVFAIACSGGAATGPPPAPPADPAAPPTTDRATLDARLRELERGFATNKQELEAKIAALEVELDACRARPIAAAPSPPPKPRHGMLDPTQRYPVPIDESPSIGPATAPVTLVAAVQFPEPYTHRAWPTIIALRAEYAKDLRIVFKSFIVHPKATASSIAACAAGQQRRLTQMEGAIYTAASDPAPGQPPAGLRELDDVELRELARGLHLDLKLYDRDVATCAAALTRDVAMFGKLGQGAVPVFWINGRPLSGAQPIEEFRKVIDEERTAAAADKARGGRVADYYERITGLKPSP